MLCGLLINQMDQRISAAFPCVMVGCAMQVGSTLPAPRHAITCLHVWLAGCSYICVSLCVSGCRVAARAKTVRFCGSALCVLPEWCWGALRADCIGHSTCIYLCVRRETSRLPPPSPRARLASRAPTIGLWISSARGCRSCKRYTNWREHRGEWHGGGSPSFICRIVLYNIESGVRLSNARGVGSCIYMVRATALLCSGIEAHN